MNPDDPRSTAKQLIEEHGGDAAVTFAVLRVIQMQTAGDESGKGTWLSILSAVLDLRTPGSRGNRPVH